MEKLEKRLYRREVKADTRKLGLGLLLYLLIMSAGAILYWGIARFTFMLNATDTEFDTFCTNSEGTATIIGVVLGIIFLFLFFLPRKTHQQIFVKNKKMTFGWFAVLTCIFFGVQLIMDPVFMGFEGLLNLMGYSALSSMESASAGSDTVSMFIYCGLVAPIVEEIVYRGFAMRILGKYGKTFAILASSILFGVMHGNLPQAIFATLVGIVLGYVAMEYSVIWSIVLHIINNMVLGDLLTYALQNTSELVSNIIWYSILGIFFALGLVAIIIKRKQIVSYIKANRWNMPYMRWTFTTVLIILFVLINIATGISMLEKI